MRAMVGPLVIVAVVAALWAFFLRGNPGGISDAKYSQFKNTRPPRLLYSCTRTPTRDAFNEKVRECSNVGRSNCEAGIDELVKTGTRTDVEFVAGASTYDQLLKEARHKCGVTLGRKETVEFRIIEADKT